MNAERETPAQIAERILDGNIMRSADHDHFALLLAEAIQAERDRAEESERELADAEALLRKLHSESMASDFNEHWESFTKAQQWLEHRRNIK